MCARMLKSYVEEVFSLMREFRYRNLQPKAVVLEDAAVPYEGSYEVTSNGTLPTAGKTMGSDLTITVQPNLTALSVTENGDYTPTAPVQGFSSVSVNVPVGGNTLKTLIDATKNAAYLFYQYQGNAVADLIKYDDTAEATTMNNMFSLCSNITSVPLLNTSKVTNMGYMFYNCAYLTSIPLFDTSSVTSMDSMFRGCSRLINISSLDTSEVTNMSSMFYSCFALISIPLLNTSKVTNMSAMFRYCSVLTSIPALDASKATNITNIFQGCYALTEIKMTGMSRDFDISSSYQFTREALVEIITNCATVDTTRTLTMGATNLAKLTQADIDLANSKGWTLS